jgi:hypothetical protein
MQSDATFLVCGLWHVTQFAFAGMSTSEVSRLWLA